MYAINHSFAKSFGGAELKKRYSELIEEAAKKEDTRTAEEIAADIIKKAGLEVKT